MGRTIRQREDIIDEIDDIEILRERLKAAERVCVLKSWSAASERDAVGRLTYNTWSEWFDLAGGQEGVSPKANKAINADLIVAERRDRAAKKRSA